MSEAMIMLEPGGALAVPSSVAVCPYCGGGLISQPTAWTQDDDDSWKASESGIECVNEPELDDDKPRTLRKWDEWWAEHSYMPYVHWLPVDVLVLDWLNSKYRFACKKNPE